MLGSSDWWHSWQRPTSTGLDPSPRHARTGLVEEGPFACVFDAHGTQLRVTPVGEITLAPSTVLGWTVDDIEAAVRALSGRECASSGTGMDQDDTGVWRAGRARWRGSPTPTATSCR